MALSKHIDIVIVVICIVTLVTCYPTFQTNIPNGNHVIDPCQGSDAIWKGVGHKNKDGKGPLNPFGEEWGRNKPHWPTVCSLDSDQDGRTNGEELGDPNCTWTKGNDVMLSRDNITHPGICEPMTSPNCTEINQWLTCNPENVTCNGTMGPDVRRLELRLNSSEVPPEETTYSCMVYDVPRDKAYDVISARPIIGNGDVIHHMVVYGCLTKDIEKLGVKPNTLVPKCFMANRSGCTSMIAAFGLWDQAMDAFCLPPDVGVRIGQGGYEQIMIQVLIQGDDSNDKIGFIQSYNYPRFLENSPVLTVGLDGNTCKINFYRPRAYGNTVLSGSQMKTNVKYVYHEYKEILCLAFDAE